MKRTSLRALLLMLGILLVSCTQDPDGTSGVVAPAGPDPHGVPGIDLDDPDLEYEEISGTLQPGNSGIMFEYLRSWPRNSLFSLIVPETSMPGGGPIHFTMSIPTEASYNHEKFRDALEGILVIRLTPDGEQFLGPITVQGTWMPWEGAPPDPLWVHNGSDWVQATVFQAGNRYRVRFDVDHFSDWEVGPEPPD